MNFSFAPPDPLAYFDSLVQSDAGFPLLEAAATLGHMQDPALDVQAVLSEHDAWTARLCARLPADAGHLPKLLALNRFFYQELGFAGNINDYYAPSNSFVHQVMESRRGIPISLALIWLELAQAIGLDACGVSFPGHFLIKISMSAGQAVIDPMTGESFSGEELKEMLAPFRSRSRPDFEPPLGLYLQAAPARDILARMLRNLKEIYKSQRQAAQWLAVQERLVRLLPQEWSEYRDRGLAHAMLGNHAQALDDLECYVGRASDGIDAEAVSGQVDQLRRQLRGRRQSN
jgi:regulator of sirC expression with transglutaminase-like and TPR domain